MGGAEAAPSGPAPRISVIIPARDEARHLEAALLSVLRQRHRDGLECIVVDNASADGTAQVAAAFQAAHPELPLRLVREPVPGRSRAKNAGAREAAGDVLVFLDADSWMSEDLVEEVVASYRAGYPAGSLRVVADSDDWLERGFFNLMELGKRLFGIRAQMLYCDRRLFEAVGRFPPDLQLAEDLVLLRRVQARLNRDGRRRVTHLSRCYVATSPRRFRRLPLRLGVAAVFLRWFLAHWGIGRRWRY